MFQPIIIIFVLLKIIINFDYSVKWNEALQNNFLLNKIKSSTFSGHLFLTVIQFAKEKRMTWYFNVTLKMLCTFEVKCTVQLTGNVVLVCLRLDIRQLYRSGRVGEKVSNFIWNDIMYGCIFFTCPYNYFWIFPCYFSYSLT